MNSEEEIMSVDFSFDERAASSSFPLPHDTFLHVTSFLDVASLLRVKSLNKYCFEQCAKDEAGWGNLCQKLWKDKVHVYPNSPTMDRMTAYRLSLEDGNHRHSLRLDELCFHPETETGPIWDFRFKEAAGPDWTSWDPWWNGRRARHMVFLPDGNLKQYVERGAEDQEDLLMHNPRVYGDPLPKTGNILLETPVSMTWRFLPSPMDLPKREIGSYLRMTVGGRDVPTYCIRRSPTGNWGFLAESCWGVYTSFRVPLREAPQKDASDERKRIHSMICDDSNYLITNEVQWREALLYNFGATMLPEGETATEEFDRMFGQQQVNGFGVAGAAALGGPAQIPLPDRHAQPVHEPNDDENMGRPT